VPFKDFSAEVRASLDVRRFLDRTYLLLHLNQNNPDIIIESLLHKMLEDSEPGIVEEAMSSIFTHDRSKHANILERTGRWGRGVRVL
jgi:sodium borate transporter 11